MSNPENDSRLEQLSREAADRYTVKASPSWDKMERELDKVLPIEKKKKRPFLFWWIIPSVLLCGSIFWYNSGTQKVQKEHIAATIVERKIHEETIETSTPQVLKQKTIDSRPFAETEKKEKKNFTDTKTFQTTSRIDARTYKINSSMAHKSDHQSLTNSSEEKKAGIVTVITSDDENTLFIHPTIDTGSNLTDKSILTAKDSTSLSIIPVQDSITMTAKDSIIQNNNKGNRYFSFSLVAGMDATSVKFQYLNRASLSGGIMIGYHLNSNWSIHTGGIYTRKNYKMEGNDFKAPPGSWVANYKLETVDGFCNMWEVPLLVRYTFNSKTKTKAFFSAGLSSYFMTRENYNYFYYFNGSPVNRNANYPKGKTHPFSILKLSVGRIKQISNYSSIVIEPFANLPLSGLGFGNVRLSSLGINFSYQLGQPNKKK